MRRISVYCSIWCLYLWHLEVWVQMLKRNIKIKKKKWNQKAQQALSNVLGHLIRCHSDVGVFFKEKRKVPFLVWYPSVPRRSSPGLSPHVTDVQDWTHRVFTGDEKTSISPQNCGLAAKRSARRHGQTVESSQNSCLQQSDEEGRKKRRQNKKNNKTKWNSNSCPGHKNPSVSWAVLWY